MLQSDTKAQTNEWLGDNPDFNTLRPASGQAKLIVNMTIIKFES